MVSFWTQLHGGIHSVHFDAWPPSWRSSRPLVVSLGRMLMLAGLVPAVLGLAGFAMAVAALRSRTGRSARGAALLELSCVAAFLIFLACYAVRLRDFSAMKAVFLLPAGLGFLALLANGLEAAQRWMRTPVFSGILAVGLGLLCLLYGLDTVSLTLQLGAPMTGN
jgi:ABC-type Na+ efflux pump permease subunit